MKKNELKRYINCEIPLQFNELNVLKKHWSRVINLFDGNVLPPYEILIHPSSVCNLNCKWCIGGYVSKKENKKMLLDNNLYTIKNMKKVIDSIVNLKKDAYDYQEKRIRTFKVENVSFSGITGEPLISKKSICYAIEELSKHSIRTGIFTNGLMISEDIFPTLSKLGYLLISIDAGKNETYQKLKGCKNKDDFDRLLLTIKKFNEYKKKVNSKTDVNVGYIINQYNYDELYILAKKLKEIGVHYFRFKTDIASLLNMKEEERKVAKELINKIKNELCDDFFQVVEIHNVLDDRSKVRMHNKCFAHYLIGNISSDGNLYPCNYHPKKGGYNYGNIIEKDLNSLWFNIIKSEIDNNIPNICPPVCDPFKNRTNYLLEKAYEIYNEKGYDYLKKCVDDIIL